MKSGRSLLTVTGWWGLGCHSCFLGERCRLRASYFLDAGERSCPEMHSLWWRRHLLGTPHVSGTRIRDVSFYVVSSEEGAVTLGLCDAVCPPASRSPLHCDAVVPWAHGRTVNSVSASLWSCPSGVLDTRHRLTFRGTVRALLLGNRLCPSRQARSRPPPHRRLLTTSMFSVPKSLFLGLPLFFLVHFFLKFHMRMKSFGVFFFLTDFA